MFSYNKYAYNAYLKNFQNHLSLELTYAIFTFKMTIQQNHFIIVYFRSKLEIIKNKNLKILN